MSEDLSNLVIGPYEPGDEAGILEAFRKVFDIDRPQAVWNWEYRDNPAGLHVFLAKLPDGKVISQFAGIPRRIKVRNEEYLFAEIVDSLTDPDYRQGLKKPGLFASTCYKFVDHYGRPDREVIMYGLPNPPAFRVGRALLGYVHLYHMELLVRPVPDGTGDVSESIAGGRGTGKRVEVFSADADALWEVFKTRHEVLTVRDRRYLDWRYAHPEVDYERVEFRDDAGLLFGLAVLRHGWLDAPDTVIVEWLFDVEHPQCPDALGNLEARARAAGSEQLKVMLRPDSPEWKQFEEGGFARESSRFRLVARTYDKDAVDLDWLRDNWFVTLGDFDIA